jgi:tetratricopeptide (TPR) repeat protein
MIPRSILLCLLLLLPVFAAPTPPELKALSVKANAQYAVGNYIEAAALNRKGYEEALARRDRPLALRFLNNTGGCWFALSSYRKAMIAFLEARELASALGDHEMAGALSLNISSLYLQIGEVAGAAEAAREGLAALSKLPKPKYKVQLLMQVARIKAWQGDLDGAIPLFGQAIAEADREGDVLLQAKACNLLGY